VIITNKNLWLLTKVATKTLNFLDAFKNQVHITPCMVGDSPERIKEKIQFAIQGVMDSSNFAIAIAVGIFGVLTLFMQISDPEL
jgi:hypothetical protein